MPRSALKIASQPQYTLRYRRPDPLREALGMGYLNRHLQVPILDRDLA